MNDIRGCPKCGCPEVRSEGTRPAGFRRRTRRVACAHCGHRYKQLLKEQESDQELETIIVQLPYCPKCLSEKPFTTGTSGATRYHKCRECGHKFKSVAKGPLAPNAARIAG